MTATLGDVTAASVAVIQAASPLPVHTVALTDSGLVVKSDGSHWRLLATDHRACCGHLTRRPGCTGTVNVCDCGPANGNPFCYICDLPKPGAGNGWLLVPA